MLLPTGKLFPLTLSAVVWSDDPESGPKSSLGLKARLEAGTLDVLLRALQGWISTRGGWGKLTLSPG